MFVDSVEIYVASGNGGAGCVSFRREKFVLQGGPDGGDGGKGGDVYFIGDKNTSTLANFRGKRKYVAQNGASGMPSNCNGKKGKDIYIKVPPGTQIIDSQSKEILCDIVLDNKKIKLLEGGKGGLGNAKFKNSINQRPTYAQKGIAGSSLNILLELKLIADVALVGFPNVGKSSLISTITNSKPKIANYEFTTLIPNLGVVDIDDFHSFVLADIPGLIEGASSGKGLGLKFLQHIERTKLLIFLLDVSRNLYNQDDINKQFEILRHELEQYSKILSERPYAIVLSKSDVLELDSFGRYKFDYHEDSFDTKVYVCKELCVGNDFIANDNRFLQNLDSKENVVLSENEIYLDYGKSENQESKDSKSKDSLAEPQSEISLESMQNKDSKKNTESQTIQHSPLFICPISSATHLNLEALKILLHRSLKLIDS